MEHQTSRVKFSPYSAEKPGQGRSLAISFVTGTISDSLGIEDWGMCRELALHGIDDPEDQGTVAKALMSDERFVESQCFDIAANGLTPYFKTLVVARNGFLSKPLVQLHGRIK